MARGTKRAPRPPLTRDRVLAAAMEMADAGGFKAISMRKLAQRLGVEAMSLYNHVSGKDDVIDGIVELVAEEIDLNPKGRGWKQVMRRRLISAHQALDRHPWAASGWMATSGYGPARIGFADSILRGLREAGFSEDIIYHGFHVLQSHVMGYVLQESNFEFTPEELKKLAAEFLDKLGTDNFPDMAEHVRQHLHPSRQRHNTFEFGLDLILDSLERQLGR